MQQHFLLSKDSSGGGSSGGGGNSRHASNQISSVGSSQTTHDPLEDTVIFNGFTKKKRKGQNDNNTKRGGLGLNKLWRTALAQEESDRCALFLMRITAKHLVGNSSQECSV